MDTAIAEQIRAVVKTRLHELQPVLTELEQLQSVLAALENPGAAHLDGLPVALGGLGGLSTSAPARARPRQRRARLGSKPGRDGRAPQGANKQRILAVIAENPGIAAPQTAKLTGLDRPLVASTISRLKRTGELLPCGDGVRLNDSSAATARPTLKEVLSAGG